MPDELELYRETIDMCADRQLNVALPNGNEVHAAVLFETFLKRASKEVMIYTGSLYEGIFNDNQNIVDKAFEFVQRSGVRLRIAFESEVQPEEVMGRAMISKIIDAEKSGKLAGGALEVYDARNAMKHNHFAVMDGTAFRQETNPASRSAYANFGDTTHAAMLCKRFEEIIARSERIYPSGSAAVSIP